MSTAFQGNREGHAPADDLVRTLAEQEILVPEPAEVLAYLRQHPDLANVLFEIGACARQEFGTQAELSLEVYGDPEIKDHYLTLYVRLTAYTVDIRSRLRAVSAPFEEELSASTGWLQVTTDFRLVRGKHAV